MEQSKYINITEASVRKGCTRSTIYKLIHEGKINIYEIGGRRFVVDDEKFRRLELRKDLRHKVNELEARLSAVESKFEVLEKKGR
jgi:excisionase family DNA binding protein